MLKLINKPDYLTMIISYNYFAIIQDAEILQNLDFSFRLEKVDFDAKSKLTIADISSDWSSLVDQLVVVAIFRSYPYAISNTRSL
jgi:hypothetical protein